MDNSMKIQFLSKSENESFARVAVAAFVSQLDPTIEELSDIKTAVSEAVTNAIIHGYEESENNFVEIESAIHDNVFEVKVIDYGKGIDDVNQAMEPLYTSRPDLERSGLGFSVMDDFMDELNVTSEKGKGTTVYMKKTINSIS